MVIPCCDNVHADGLLDEELQRAQGAGRIVLSGDDGRTRIVDVFQRYPLRVMFPRAYGCAIEEAVLVNASGGVAGGDRLELAVIAREGATIAVTSQAAEKVYRALSEPARVSTRLDVSETAKLAWLPQETILFDGARLHRETQINLVSGAELLALEWLVLGRTACRETLLGGHISDSWRVSIDGRLVWADSFRVTDQVVPSLGSRALLSTTKALGTLVCFDAHPDRRLEFFRDVGSSLACRCAATSVAGLVVVRFAAIVSCDLRLALHSLLLQFDREFGPGPFRVPKMWSC
jgi:urease accessory protein